MELEKFLLQHLDTYFKVQCSNSKSSGYKYEPIDKALVYNFIRFGNKFFIPAISVDIDNAEYPTQKIKELNLPEPTLVVETTRGYHIHWFLTNPIKTSNTRQLKMLNSSLSVLQEALGGDKYATTGNSGRVWRNPLQHTHYFSGKTYNFSEIHKISNEEKKKEPQKYKKTKISYGEYLTLDFSKIYTGSRHMSLFNYGRAFAYTTGMPDILQQLEEKNAEMPNPLPKNEVKSIAKSIKDFMETKYMSGSLYTSSQSRIKFNQRVAKGQEKKKLLELSSKLLNFFAPLQVIKKSTVRQASALLGTSKSTWSKHKAELLRIIMELFNTKLVFFKNTDNFLEPCTLTKRLYLANLSYNSS